MLGIEINFFRARRIKCDEKKPECDRCSRSRPRRFCEGYAERSLSQKANPSAPHEISPSPRHQQLAKKGLHSLTFGLPAPSDDLFHAFETKLLELTATVSAVNACAYTLGIVHELRQEIAFDAELAVLAESCHATALRDVKDLLESNKRQSLALAVACALLAVTELLCEHTQNAILHLRGARKVLSDDNESETSSMASLLLTAIDLRIATHALQYAPVVTTHWPAVQRGFATDASSRYVWLMEIQVEALAWAAKISASNNGVQSDVYNTCLTAQAQHIAHLEAWLVQFDSSVSHLYKSAKECEKVLKLRITCLASLIHISALLGADETRYAVYAPYFQQIVLDAESILRRTPARDDAVDVRSLVAYPGMNWALCLTAQRYRDSSWRRRAIQCLRQNGYELLFDGMRDAEVCERLMEFEDPSVESSLLAGYSITEDAESLRSDIIRVEFTRQNEKWVEKLVVSPRQNLCLESKSLR